MFIKANYYSLSPRRFIAGTKNSYGVETITFAFSSEWDGLAKTVTFYPVKGEPVAVVYGTGPIIIPSEVMKHPGLAKFTLSGYKNECSLISITGYMDILDANDPGGDLPVAPTPSEMAQVLTMMNAAVETAESVRRDADNGVFKGEKGDPGDPSNVDEIVEAVMTKLPASDADAINSIENTVDFEPVLFNDYLHEGKWETTSPGVTYDEAPISCLKIPCNAGEIYKVSFKGRIPYGTPCFVKNKDGATIQYIYANADEPESDKEKIFTVATGGKTLVINYLNAYGIPHIYRYKNTDTTVWSLPSYWFSALETAEKTITSYQNSAGVDGFTFGFITDTHTPKDHPGGYARLMKHVLDSCKIPLFLHGGDFVEGAGGISKEDILAEIKHYKDIFSDIEDKCLQALGNHDASYGINSYYDGALSKSELYNRIFRDNEKKNGIVRGSTGRYFYKDNHAQRVRYIILDCFATTDNPMLSDAQFGNEQLNWLANALKVESGYSIVICSHIAPYRESDLSAIEWTAENRCLDAEIALGIVNAYRNKTSYTNSNTVSGESYNINVDYSSRKGEIVCWIAGHTHKDYVFDLDGLKAVCTANSGSHISVAPVGYAPIKNLDPPDDTEFIMDFVCVDRATKSCNVVRLGAALEGMEVRSFEYASADPSDSNTENGGKCSATITSDEEYGSITIYFTEGMTWANWCSSEDGQLYNAYSDTSEQKFDIGGVTHILNIADDAEIEVDGIYTCGSY